MGALTMLDVPSQPLITSRTCMTWVHVNLGVVTCTRDTPGLHHCVLKTLATYSLAGSSTCRFHSGRKNPWVEMLRAWKPLPSAGQPHHAHLKHIWAAQL